MRYVGYKVSLQSFRTQLISVTCLSILVQSVEYEDVEQYEQDRQNYSSKSRYQSLALIEQQSTSEQQSVGYKQIHDKVDYYLLGFDTAFDIVGYLACPLLDKTVLGKCTTSV